MPKFDFFKIPGYRMGDNYFFKTPIRVRYRNKIFVAVCISGGGLALGIKEEDIFSAKSFFDDFLWDVNKYMHEIQCPVLKSLGFAYGVWVYDLNCERVIPREVILP